MKRNIFKHICQGTLLAAVALCTVSCEDELDSELFTKYSYLMDNGWQENIEMPINDDNTVDLPVYFGVNGTSGNDKDIIVKLDVDADTLSLFNFDKFKNETASYYDLLPADCYTFDKPLYTIPKGDLNAKAVCRIDLATLRQHDIYNEYVLPVKIASSEGEVVGPSRYTKALYYLNFTNKYSGVYAGNGTIKQLARLTRPRWRANSSMPSLKTSAICMLVIWIARKRDINSMLSPQSLTTMAHLTLRPITRL